MYSYIPSKELVFFRNHLIVVAKECTNICYFNVIISILYFFTFVLCDFKNSNRFPPDTNSMIKAKGSSIVQQPIILTTNGLHPWATFFIKLISCKKSCLSSPPAPSVKVLNTN